MLEFAQTQKNHMCAAGPPDRATVAVERRFEPRWAVWAPLWTTTTTTLVSGTGVYGSSWPDTAFSAWSWRVYGSGAQFLLLLSFRTPVPSPWLAHWYELFIKLSIWPNKKLVIQNDTFFEGVSLKPSASPLPPEITTTDGKKTSSSLHFYFLTSSLSKSFSSKTPSSTLSAGCYTCQRRQRWFFATTSSPWSRTSPPSSTTSPWTSPTGTSPTWKAFPWRGKSCPTFPFAGGSNRTWKR